MRGHPRPHVDEMGDVNISMSFRTNTLLSNSHEGPNGTVVVCGREFRSVEVAFHWDRARWYFKEVGIKDPCSAADESVPTTFTSAEARTTGTRAAMTLHIASMLGMYKSRVRKKLKALDARWSTVADKVMMRALRAKFCARNPEMVDALLATGRLKLCERASWGVPNRWTGRRGSFGKLLSVVRAELCAEL